MLIIFFLISSIISFSVVVILETPTLVHFSIPCNRKFSYEFIQVEAYTSGLLPYTSGMLPSTSGMLPSTSGMFHHTSVLLPSTSGLLPHKLCKPQQSLLEAYLFLF